MKKLIPGIMLLSAVSWTMQEETYSFEYASFHEPPIEIFNEVNTDEKELDGSETVESVIDFLYRDERETTRIHKQASLLTLGFLREEGLTHEQHIELRQLVKQQITVWGGWQDLVPTKKIVRHGKNLEIDKAYLHQGMLGFVNGIFKEVRREFMHWQLQQVAKKEISADDACCAVVEMLGLEENKVPVEVFLGEVKSWLEEYQPEIPKPINEVIRKVLLKVVAVQKHHEPLLWFSIFVGDESAVSALMADHIGISEH